MSSSETEWFSQWFDSPYYHILYSNRDENEAAHFIDNLVDHLQLNPTDKILDLACGKGRYAIYLNSLGFRVEGVDLSSNSIKIAKTSENDRLGFFVHDMRYVYKPAYFDYVLNLFTSFGYFDNEADNLSAICAASANLRPGGKLVIDFMNTPKVIQNLKADESKEIGGITFNIERKLIDGYIIKEIRFTDQNHQFYFNEKVKAIHKDDFLNYFKEADLKVKEIFGNYDLSTYDETKSDRMIFILQKD